MAGEDFADGWTWLVVSEETAHKKSAIYVRKHKWRMVYSPTDFSDSLRFIKSVQSERAVGGKLSSLAYCLVEHHACCDADIQTLNHA